MPVFLITPLYKELVDRFYQDAESYGWNNLPKTNLIVTQRDFDDPKHDFTKNSLCYQQGDQWIVEIEPRIRMEFLLIPIYRELGHILLFKDYLPSGDANIMNPWFGAMEFSDRGYDKVRAKPFLDKLFER